MAGKREREGKADLPIPGVSSSVVLLRTELAKKRMKQLRTASFAGLELTLARGRDGLWLLVRKPGRGGLAHRAAFFPAGIDSLRMVRRRKGELMRAEGRSPIGVHRISVSVKDGAIPLIRITSSLEPSLPLLASYIPRDIYPLDEDDDPIGAVGQVEAAQRGLNTGAIYFRLEKPAFGSVLYLQDLTAMNRYFAQTETTPDGAMGGLWPEIGYFMPVPSQRGTPPANPLAPGEEVTLADGWLAFHEESNRDEQEMARRYLMLLAEALRVVQRPETTYHDWVERAERSLADLANSPKATVRHYGHLYVHPYTDAEYPDSMVQLTVLAALRDYEQWSGGKVPLGKALAAGLERFYDPELKTLRRYLPNVGDDKNANAVDSWYLYHPLTKLGRLALDGDAQALDLFNRSIGYGIAAAHHFDYRWPIQYDVRDFSVITAARNDSGLGQTDVGGIYAYLMLLAFELTDDPKYLDEARAAIDATMGMRFELNYQANLTAWGAAACLRLWRITSEATYLQQCYVYLASFFHNTAMWESEIKCARHYPTFLGVTALHDAPYMAMYECFDSFAAFDLLLKDGGPDLDPAARLLVTEYCRHALDNAWYYYPDALPPEAVSPTQRKNNGHIDRDLSFPVEDLYVDGQQAGQVGQEIYGCGAAFVFASRAFHPVEGAPFRMFCDHFLMVSRRPSARGVSFQLSGSAGVEAVLILIADAGAKLPRFTVSSAGAGKIEPSRRAAEQVEYRVPANGLLTILWD